MQNHFYNAKLQALKALLIEYKIIYLICNIYYQLLITFFTIAVLKIIKNKKLLRFNLDALFFYKNLQLHILMTMKIILKSKQGTQRKGLIK